MQNYDNKAKKQFPIVDETRKHNRSCNPVENVSTKQIHTSVVHCAIQPVVGELICGKVLTGKYIQPGNGTQP